MHFAETASVAKYFTGFENLNVWYFNNQLADGNPIRTLQDEQKRMEDIYCRTELLKHLYQECGCKNLGCL